MAWDRIRRILGWAVILVAVSVVVVEAAGRSVAERIVENQIRTSGVAGGVDVTIGRSWWQPSIVGVLLFDTLDQIEIRLNDARLYSTRVAEADYVLTGLDLDLSFRDRTAGVRSIGSGSVRVLIDPSAIAVMVGGGAEIRDGSLYLGGSEKPSAVRISGSDLVVEGDAVKKLVGSDSITLPVADSQILPCSPEARLVDRYVELSCTGNTLPGVLSTSLSSNAGDLPTVDQSELTPPATLELPPSSTTTRPGGQGG